MIRAGVLLAGTLAVCGAALVPVVKGRISPPDDQEIISATDGTGSTMFPFIDMN
jgi:hypothetical protein